jgi:hypothetical protein
VGGFLNFAGRHCSDKPDNGSFSKLCTGFSNFAETQPESLKQNQNWERTGVPARAARVGWWSDQPYTQLQKHTEKMRVSKWDWRR